MDADRFTKIFDTLVFAAFTLLIALPFIAAIKAWDWFTAWDE